MKWQHECSLSWLKTRQKFLSATDVKDLLPITATGRKRNVTDETRMKVWARKCTALTKEDCKSTGVMARGHILEPYAIDMFNSKEQFQDYLYHWDDIVVTNNLDDYCLAFSPDACNIPQHMKGMPLLCMKFNTELTAIGEVKSYSPEAHMIAGVTPTSALQERWQVAAAMAAVPSIERGYLLFYNPSMEEQLFVHCMNREDLEYEINMCLEVEADWLDFIDRLGNLYSTSDAFMFTGDKEEELRIIDKIIEEEKLSPKKTIVE